MKEKLLNLKKEDLTKSHVIENSFVLIAVFILAAFALIPFIGYGNLINSIAGAVSITIAVITFTYTFNLYGLKSQEGKVWFVLTVSLLIILASNIISALGNDLLYYILRFISIPIMTFGLLLKIKFTGFDLDLSQKTVAGILFVGWILLVFVSSFLPAAGGGFDLSKDSYAIFATAEIFAFMIAIFIIQIVKVKGWYYISIGLVVISMGDIFHPLAQDYNLTAMGSPIRLFWYFGLLLAAYGAYHQRKEHLKMIAL
ncbi:MAG: hypothetical protein ACQESD_02415 [Thermoplasmatota archaeon]